MLVTSMFGGISAGLTRSIRAVAQQGAAKLFNRMGSIRHCQATLLWQARRDIGVTIWAANSDLILRKKNIANVSGFTVRGREAGEKACG